MFLIVSPCGPTDGKAMFQMLGVFAEFERELIRERIAAGIARAQEKGTRSGKPIGRPTVINPSLVGAVLAKRRDGSGIRRVARELNVGVGTVQKIVRSYEVT